MLGAPIVRPATDEVVEELGDPCDRVSAKPAPPAAAPAIKAIQSHLCPPWEALNSPWPPAPGAAPDWGATPGWGATPSLKYCVLTIAARAWSFTAVMRI
jgi:hypothetical protein